MEGKARWGKVWGRPEVEQFVCPWRWGEGLRLTFATTATRANSNTPAPRSPRHPASATIYQ